MTLKDWEEKVLSRPGAWQRIGMLEGLIHLQQIRRGHPVKVDGQRGVQQFVSTSQTAKGKKVVNYRKDELGPVRTAYGENVVALCPYCVTRVEAKKAPRNACADDVRLG